MHVAGAGGELDRGGPHTEPNSDRPSAHILNTHLPLHPSAGSDHRWHAAAALRRRCGNVSAPPGITPPRLKTGTHRTHRRRLPTRKMMM